MCILSNDLITLSIFKGNSDISQLYQQVMVWLGKRFIAKCAPILKGTWLKNISAGDVWASDEFIIVKQVAYETFLHNISLGGDTIHKAASVVNNNKGMTDVYKYGLLKVDNAKATVDMLTQERKQQMEADEDDLLNKEYSFIHLSFQEYLTACYLKELLSSTDPMVYKESAEWIGVHRNEPRYLLTLKFHRRNSNHRK